jgi:hypothetical protein
MLRISDNPGNAIDPNASKGYLGRSPLSVKSFYSDTLCLFSSLNLCDIGPLLPVIPWKHLEIPRHCLLCAFSHIWNFDRTQLGTVLEVDGDLERVTCRLSLPG